MIQEQAEKKGKNTAIDGANRKNNRVDFNSVNIKNYVEWKLGSKHTT